MRLAELGLSWIVVFGAGCGPNVTLDRDDAGESRGTRGTDDTADASSVSTTSPSTTVGPQTSTTTSTVTTSGDSTTVGGVPDGEQCDEDMQCASGHCFIVGVLGGICGECASDDDCPAGGCTPPIDAQPSVCNTGQLGGGCQSDAACQDPLMCALLYDVSGVIAVSTCSECSVDDDCPFGQLCSPESELPDDHGQKMCVTAGSQPLGETCDHTTTGDQACAAGICEPADIMGLLEIGVCSACADDGDCPANTICQPPWFDLQQGPMPGECS